MKFLIIVIILIMISSILMSCSSKKPEDLGVNEGRLAVLPSSPNGVSTFAEESDEEHYIEALVFEGSVEVEMKKIKNILASWPRTELITETDTYLHFECTTLLLRFVDDLEIFLDEATGLIHFRSASRVGHSDFGVNRKRVESLKAALK